MEGSAAGEESRAAKARGEDGVFEGVEEGNRGWLKWKSTGLNHKRGRGKHGTSHKEGKVIAALPEGT